MCTTITKFRNLYLHNKILFRSPQKRSPSGPEKLRSIGK